MRMIDLATQEEWLREYDFYKEFKTSPYFDILIDTLENLNTDILFKSEIHGQAHIERVIFFAHILAWKYDLDKNDTDIIRYAASLHDTRREHDGWDTEHGRRAAIDSIDYATVVPADKNVLQAVITAHSAPDDEMVAIIEEYEVDDFERTLFLAKLFKDSDGLDRVRINRLDPAYLRNDFSKELVDFAYRLYENY